MRFFILYNSQIFSLNLLSKGQMLINWFVSCFDDVNYVKDILITADQKYVANQFCTLLLAAGVLKQIEDAEGNADKIFRVRQIINVKLDYADADPINLTHNRHHSF